LSHVLSLIPLAAPERIPDGDPSVALVILAKRDSPHNGTSNGTRNGIAVSRTATLWPCPRKSG